LSREKAPQTSIVCQKNNKKTAFFASLKGFSCRFRYLIAKNEKICYNITNMKKGEPP
jgi:hypothetical protein